MVLSGVVPSSTLQTALFDGEPSKTKLGLSQYPKTSVSEATGAGHPYEPWAGASALPLV